MDLSALLRDQLQAANSAASQHIKMGRQSMAGDVLNDPMVVKAASQFIDAYVSGENAAAAAKLTAQHAQTCKDALKAAIKAAKQARR